MSLSGDRVVFEKLKKLVFEATNTNCGYYREAYLKRRFIARMRKTEAKTYGDYVRYLKRNPDEYSLLLNDLFINWTQFFRDLDVFSFLKTTILPEVCSSGRLVRIWSAGCATGEEAYSIAILVHEVLRRRLKDFQITIYASDIDTEALAKARRGEYKRSEVQDIEEKILSRYFSCEGQLYSVKDFVRQLICFEHNDLINAPQHRNLDLILCRNVAMFFLEEAQNRIYMNLYNSLRDGGYIITGKTEVPRGEAHQKLVCVSPRSRVYKKPSGK